MKIEIDGVEYLPAVPIEELPRYIHCPDGTIRNSGNPSATIVYLQDIEKAVPTRPCDCGEKVRELEENCEELQARANCAESSYKTANQIIETMQGTIDTLREQLAGRWVPCNLEDISVGDFFLVYQYDAKQWSVGLRDMESMVSHPDSVYWKLPTLPQPEVPAVPGVGDIPEALASALRDILLDELGSDEAEELLGSIIHDPRLLAALNESEATE